MKKEMRNKILIVTSKDDGHADHVIARINATGAGKQVVRLNTEDFVTNCRGVFDGEQFRLTLADSGRRLASDQIKSVWFRRPQDFILPSEADQGVQAFIVKQATAFLRGLYFCCHDEALWVNPLPALHRSRFKLQQLQLARRVGLRVPRTLVTNEARAAEEFCAALPKVCTKSLDEPNFRLDGHLYPMLTRVLEGRGEIIAHRASIERCPVLLQEYIEKRFDLRVIVLGKRLFAFAIYSQAHPLARTDTRGAAPQLLAHCPHELPAEVARRILNFVRRQGLVYSALDFAVSAAGEYFFLENNPNGQWLWLETQTGVDLTSELISLLAE